MTFLTPIFIAALIGIIKVMLLKIILFFFRLFIWSLLFLSHNFMRLFFRVLDPSFIAFLNNLSLEITSEIFVVLAWFGYRLRWFCIWLRFDFFFLAWHKVIKIWSLISSFGFEWIINKIGIQWIGCVLFGSLPLLIIMRKCKSLIGTAVFRKSSVPGTSHVLTLSFCNLLHLRWELMI